MPPLDPQRLTPAASLNRVQLVDLPGFAIDLEAKGKTGGQLVSALVSARLIRQYADDLRLDPNLDDHSLRQSLDQCFASPNTTVRSAAEAIGRRIGRNLGHILLTLKRGDAINRAARDEWDDSYWDHWNGIQRVWLGGGLVSGQMGSHISQHAKAVIKEAGISSYTVQVSPHTQALPLVGAARHAPPTCQTALVFDLGHTMIKCARATYKNGKLRELCRLPSHPSKWTEIEQTSNDPIQQATRLFRRMISVIATTWHHAKMPPASPILVSLAAYVQNGHPITTRGAYGQLRHITDNLQTELTQQLGNQLGGAMDISLIHDGTAAATAYAGMENTAVIMLGTALGIGFPPPANNLRAISPKLTILEL
ncbi:MAG: hypothetical protein GY832_41145 [Chloroflexi bacterium]|nr:hypothetical protein [Chloroflexota bacterium]